MKITYNYKCPICGVVINCCNKCDKHQSVGSCSECSHDIVWSQSKRGTRTFMHRHCISNK